MREDRGSGGVRIRRHRYRKVAEKWKVYMDTGTDDGRILAYNNLAIMTF